MENLKNMEERLWDFIDGLSTPAEKAAILQLIEQDSNWKQAYSLMLDVSKLLQENSLEEPSMRFTKNVMEEIAHHKIAPATKSYVNKKIIYSIGGFFLLLIGTMLVYLFTQINFSEAGSIKLPKEMPFMQFDWSAYANSTTLNIFLMVDAVLGLFLLDKFLQLKKDKLKVRVP